MIYQEGGRQLLKKIGNLREIVEARYQTVYKGSLIREVGIGNHLMDLDLEHKRAIESRLQILETLIMTSVKTIDSGKKEINISKATDVSRSGLDFIPKHEGCYLKVYKDIAGLETIGYGHLIKPGENFSKGITHEEALELLKKDTDEAIDAIKRYIKIELTQNQFDALVSFTFNVGGGALKRSTLLKLINSGNTEGIRDSFLMWNKARVEGKLRSVKGLTIRREKEARLFLEEKY